MSPNPQTHRDPEPTVKSGLGGGGIALLRGSFYSLALLASSVLHSFLVPLFWS